MKNESDHVAKQVSFSMDFLVLVPVLFSFLCSSIFGGLVTCVYKVEQV